MLSMSKPMSPGSASTYHGKDDYYIGVSGVWHGKGAERLNLTGSNTTDKELIPSNDPAINLVEKETNDASKNLDSNNRSSDSSTVKIDEKEKNDTSRESDSKTKSNDISAVKDKESGITTDPEKPNRSINKEDFNKILEGFSPAGEELRFKNPKNRAAIDLTFSAPKSLSILAIFDNSLIKLHDEAVSNTLNYIEKNFAQTRIQVNGQKTIENTGNLLIAKFNHFTSRELDPQLHTHSLVMNATQGADGKWRSLHNDLLYKNKMNMGLVYRNELANLLKKRGIAIEMTDSKQFFFEIKGVDQDLIDTFSKRRKQIEDKAQAIKESGKYSGMSHGELYAIAALGSRKAKTNISKEELETYWKDIIKEKGKDLDSLINVKEEPEKLLNPTHDINKFLTSRESAFTSTDFVVSNSKVNFGNTSLSETENTFEKAIEAKDILNLGKLKTNNDGQVFYSTSQMVDIEKTVLDKAAKSNDFQLESFKSAHQFLEKYQKDNKREFTQGQRQAFLTAITSSDPINIIQGDAGTGKTTYLKAINAFSKKYNFDVIGVGFTGKSAQEMSEVGIESSTINAFLKADNPIKKGSLVIMDEASMTGSIHFNEVLDKIGGNAKIIIQGDMKQLPAISAGRMHDVLFDKACADKIELKESLRQNPNSKARENINAFNVQGIEGLLFSLKNQDNIRSIVKMKDTINSIKSIYLEKTRDKKNIIVLTDTNKDKDLINDSIRDHLKKSKQLKNRTEKQFRVLHPKSFEDISSLFASFYTEGHEILLLDNYAQMKKGQRGKITKRDFDSNILTVNTEGKEVNIDLLKAKDKFLVFEPKEKKFAVKDKIIFLRNDKFKENDKVIEIKNGMTGTIEDVNKDGLVVSIAGGKKVTLDLKSKNGYKEIDHGYAMTIHKSQGITSDDTIYFHTEGKASANSFYVAATRARQETIVFSKSAKALEKQIKDWQIKKSTTDFDIPHDNKIEIKPKQNEIEIER